MAAAVLRRIDDAQNMARFYELDIQPTLFGDIGVIRHWGRIGSRGQSMQEWPPSDEAANDLVAKLTKRGYLSPAPSQPTSNF